MDNVDVEKVRKYADSIDNPDLADAKAKYELEIINLRNELEAANLKNELEIANLRNELDNANKIKELEIVIWKNKLFT